MFHRGDYRKARGRLSTLSLSMDSDSKTPVMRSLKRENDAQEILLLQPILVARKSISEDLSTIGMKVERARTYETEWGKGRKPG